MIVFDIESGRIDAPSFNQPAIVAIQSETDVARPDMTLPVPRLMTLEEAIWMESRHADAGVTPVCKIC